jgi:cytochrome c556
MHESATIFNLKTQAMSKLSPLKLPLLLTLLASLFLVGACSEGARDTHPEKLLTKRLAIFKQFTKTLEPMGLVARDRKDYVKAEFVESANALKELSTQPWVYFSADGNYPPTRAKPDVWSQPDAFKKATNTYLSAVDHLVTVADSGDRPNISAAVDAVQKSCKSCHDQFRSDRS